MIRRALPHPPAALPLTALAAPGIPWWAAAILVSLGPAAYLCRQILLYKLAARALDKAPPTQIAAIMTAITGRNPTKPHA